MNPRTLVLVGAMAAVAAMATATAHAQGMRPVTLDATLGKGTGRTDGIYRDDNRTGVTLDAMLAVRIRALTRGALVAGVNGSVQGAGPYDTVCLPAPGGGCIPAFPEFEMVGALLGWQDRNAFVRATAGAAYVQAEGWSVAWQGRVDLALPVTSHVAPVASLRGTLIPNDPRGDSFHLFAFGLGLRIF
jgi:hypothetical protein